MLQELLEGSDRLLVERLDDVAFLQAGLLGRALGHDAEQANAALDVLAEAAEGRRPGEAAAAAAPAEAAPPDAGPLVQGDGHVLRLVAADDAERQLVAGPDVPQQGV